MNKPRTCVPAAVPRVACFSHGVVHGTACVGIAFIAADQFLAIGSCFQCIRGCDSFSIRNYISRITAAVAAARASVAAIRCLGCC